MISAIKAMRVVMAIVALGAVYTCLVSFAITTTELSDAQKTNTLRFLRSFTEYNAQLKSLWTGDDFCQWLHVDCSDAGGPVLSLLQLSPSQALSQLPDLPADVDGSQVVITQLSFVGDAINAPASLGTLPESWGRLTSVTNIGMSNCALTGTLPDSWGGMIALVTASLWGNQLSGTLPASWGRMAALATLDLQQNQLTGTLPWEWGTMPALQSLYLNANQLSGSLPDAWACLSALQTLRLQTNQLTGSIPEQWAHLDKLSDVALTNNELCGCSLTVWAGIATVMVDAAVRASDCATANACPADSSSRSSSEFVFSSSSSFELWCSSLATSSGSAANGNGNENSNSNAGAQGSGSHNGNSGSGRPVECLVSHCTTCATTNNTICAECAQSYELTGEKQCAQKAGDGGVRARRGAAVFGSTALAFAVSILFLF